MSLEGSDAVLHVMNRLSQVKQSVSQGKYFKDPEMVDTIFNEAIDMLKGLAKILILEELEKKNDGNKK